MIPVTLCLICIVLWTMPAFAQDIIVKSGSETFSAKPVGDKIWSFQMDGNEYYIVRRAEMDTVANKLRQRMADVAHLNDDIARKDSLLSMYRDYKTAADAHVDKLTALNVKADSLYHGYQGLYTDLKKLVGFTDFGLAGGLGARIEDGFGPAFAAIGAYFKNFEALYCFGSAPKSLLVTVRVPLSGIFPF